MKRVAIALSAALVLSASGCDKSPAEDLTATSQPSGEVPTAAPTDHAAAAAPPDSAAVRALQDAAVEKAVATLDLLGGQDADLEGARVRLERVLAENPRHVQARVELARYYLKSGYASGRSIPDPRAVARAADELDHALKIDPQSANAHVLLGIVRVDQNVPQMAIEELNKAEAIGTDNLWLDLNFVSAYIAMERWDEARMRLDRFERKLAAKPDTPARFAIAAAEDWFKIHDASHDREAMSADHERMIALQPDHPWLHGNYAWHLLTEVGKTDAAITQARRALELMDYGNGRRTLGLALYAKWASLRSSNPKQAKAIFDEAQATLQDLDFAMVEAGAAVERNPDFKPLVKELLARKVSIDAKDSDGDTALWNAVARGNRESAKWLIANGANVSERDDRQVTPLARAATAHDIEVVNLLVAHGADVNALDEAGYSPLHRAVAMNDERMVARFIALKAEVGKPRPDGATPLMHAAVNGQTAIARMLLAAGADRSLKTRDGRDAAALAEQGGHADIVAMLRGSAAEK